MAEQVLPVWPFRDATVEETAGWALPERTAEAAAVARPPVALVQPRAGPAPLERQASDAQALAPAQLEQQQRVAPNVAAGPPVADE